LKDDGQGQYCIFTYTVTDIDGTVKKILLEDNKAYYIEDKKKFVYILNGTDTLNKLSDNVEKYILVTAVDVDSNEIDNVDAEQKITKGQNMLSITPQDQVASGFTTASLAWDITKTKLIVTFNRPKIYIDGTPLSNSIPITYQIYDNFVCNNNVNANLCQVQPPYKSLAELLTSTDPSPLSKDLLKTEIIGTKQIGVIAVIDKGQNNYKQYYYTFAKDIPLII
jgi:hypothetical protein